MPFNNPIIGNTALIRDAIESQNYIPGIAGWKISKDGIAEFNDLVTRGYASGPNASYDVISANDDLYVAGVSIEELLANSATGLVAYADYSVLGGPAANGTEYVFMRLSFTAQPGRHYQILFSNFDLTPVANTFARVWYSTNGVPAGPGVSGSTLSHSFDTNSSIVLPLASTETEPVTYSLAVSLLNQSGVGAYVRGSYAYVGQEHAKIYVLDMGAAIGIQNTGEVVPIPGSPPPPAPPTYTYHQFDEYAAATYSYQSNGTILSDGSNDKMYQGNFGGYGGNRYSLALFNVSPLIGVPLSRYRLLQLTMHCEHAYNHDGASIQIGYKAYDGSIRPSLASVNVVSGQTVAVNIPSSMIAAIWNGTLNYILIGPGPNESAAYYAYLDGTLSGNGIGLHAQYYN